MNIPDSSAFLRSRLISPVFFCVDCVMLIFKNKFFLLYRRVAAFSKIPLFLKIDFFCGRCNSLSFIPIRAAALFRDASNFRSSVNKNIPYLKIIQCFDCSFAQEVPKFSAVQRVLPIILQMIAMIAKIFCFQKWFSRYAAGWSEF